MNPEIDNLIRTPGFAAPPPRPGERSKSASENAQNYDLKLCAVLDATGSYLEDAELAAATDVPVERVAKFRKLPKYRAMVTRLIREQASRAMEIESSAESAEDMFNAQIAQSLAALVQVRDNPFAKDGDIVKAAKEILDRAPASPKPTKEVQESRTIVQIPIRQMNTIVGTLNEIGRGEVAKLVEGVREVEVIEGEIASP